MKTKISYILLINICITSISNTFSDIILVEAYDQLDTAVYVTPEPIENGPKIPKAQTIR
jgi:hypothetical protein